ncbi:COG4315 family predicted lipoprotein [Allopusillimonas ginsengisoli]|uniref:COG4315 family predicted lipoprotein n=1 Tax=Allopusillimonas ginsengisoli TaxID=453575 RepID=UPI001021D2ED|nr:hypothetical protein [Allopusillimonas ginsengisoli]TEA78906.1 hypothetical protein ERE07_05775 [Allopusillimonas ginsengisoli]
MNTRNLTTLCFAASLLFAGGAYAQAPAAGQDGVLVDKAGMTVYTFDKDTANNGTSACADQCAKAWPPVVADSSAKPEGEYSVIMRTDGTQQWAFRGMPLYTFAKDTQPGEKKGDNFKDIWHVVTP